MSLIPPMSPHAKTQLKTYELRLDVGSEGVGGKRAAIEVRETRRKSKKGRLLARKNKKKVKQFFRIGQEVLLDEVCAYVKGICFLQKDVILKREAKRLFGTKSAFGTPRRRIIVRAEQGTSILWPEHPLPLDRRGY